MSFKKNKRYPESYIPENRHQFRQLMLIFWDAPFIRDIDFSHWYKYVSIIVETYEYLDSEFPFDSVFHVKFLGVRRFNFVYESENEKESSVDSYIRGLSPGNIEQFTKEKKGDDIFYRIVTSARGTMPRLEIDFKDVEVMFIGTSEMIDRIERTEDGKIFLTPQAKEKILFRHL